jgi:hypothetical protein
MNREQFIKAAGRVSLYGNLLMGLTGVVVVTLSSLLLLWADPVLRDFGRLVRGRARDDALAGMIFGLVSVLALAPLLVIPLLPAVWVDRQFGLRCPSCARSVTLRCRHDEVKRTGRCCRCQAVLFSQGGDS